MHPEIKNAYDNMTKNNNKIFRKTELQLSERLSELYECNVYLKREDLQYVRSFKCRGAYNAILNVKDEGKTIVCASAGNHAQGVAHACVKLGLDCEIYVPETTPLQKINKIKKFGKDRLKLFVTGKTFDDCLDDAKKMSEGKIFIHPFDNEDIINGQGTVALEIFEDINPDIIICSIGGGGLISGILQYVCESNRECKIIGVEAEKSDAMYLSIKKGEIVPLENIDNFVDGTCVKRVGEKTFEICKRFLSLEDIKIVTKGKLCNDMINLYQEDGIIVEPAGVLSISSLSQIHNIKGKNVVCVLSGGNNDVLRYQEIMEHNLIYLKTRHYFVVEFRQKPGELMNYILEVTRYNADIIRFEYIKSNNKSCGSVLIGLDMIDKKVEVVIKKMIELDYKFKKINEDDILYNLLI